MKNPRFLKSWSKRNLPDELWPEIFSRLPVKSLLRFRSVSTSWRDMIDDPNFTRSHLTRFNNNRNQTHLLAIEFKYQKEECVVRCSRTLRRTARLGYLHSNPASIGTLRTTPASIGVFTWNVLCSIDGLLMLKNCKSIRSADLMLWNPSIRKTLILPPSPGIDSRNLDFGLGFDPSIRDYKHVRFVISGTGGIVFVSVYTIGTNSWKTVRFQGEEGWKRCFGFAIEQKTLSFGGVIYGLARNSDSTPLKLVSFDLRTEVFDSTALPADDDLNSVFFSRELAMTDGGCSLALVYLVNHKGSLWVLESLGDGIRPLSWTQRYTFSVSITGYDVDRYPVNNYFFYLKKNDEMLLTWRGMVESYNLETHEEKIMHKNVLSRGKAWPYIESLILLK